MQDYEINGRYAGNGCDAILSGGIRILDDDRVIGCIYADKNDLSYCRGKSRLILGSKKDHRIAFWKVAWAPFVSTVVYVLDEIVTGTYKGRWNGVSLSIDELAKGTCGNRGLPEMALAFNPRSFERKLEILSKIDKERIDSYLDESFLRGICKTKNEAHIVLSPISSFSA